MFIEKANKLHNLKYNYSLVNYINSKTKVKIICPIHGIFEQTPEKHLIGQGCPKCAKNYKLNTSQFIKKVKKIHKSKYDYSLVNYKNMKENIKIICLFHGVFEQTPNNHLNGKGCPKCAKNKKITQNSFIEKAKEKHDDKYDYSLVNYKNSKTKVKIICPIHGIFEQTPDNHIHKKYGCSKCNGKFKNTNEFINISEKSHDKKYNYSLVDYKNGKTKVKIICPIHGVFEQTPEKHLIGQGCPKCNNSHGENEIEKILNNKNILFETQKKFKNCKDKYYLPFDFYLPEYNLCIEFDGIQHFKPIDYFGGEEKFKLQQKRDSIKNIYCKENNINLLRIKYNENIKEKIETLNNYING